MHFLVRSKGDERFVVRLADTTLEHAESVMRSVKLDPDCPDDLTLEKVSDPHHPKRPWWKRRS